MKNFLFVLVLFPSVLFSQKKTCNTPKKEVFEDLNSIVKTKCSVKSSNDKKPHQLSVSISANKTRFLKRRMLKKVSNKSLDSKGLAALNASSALKNKTISVLNTLSIDEVKKCDRFIDVDNIPAFESCSSEKGDARLECFNESMIDHIVRHFSYPEEAIVKKIEGEVWVRFIIDATGSVTNVKMHASKGKEMLKDEALRVVSQLPKFIPATKKGKNVSVKYGFPINFSLTEE